MIPEKLCLGLVKITHSYANTPRVIITGERHEKIIQSGLVSKYDYDNEAVREPLIEHIGHLPIIASFLYPHIEHRKSVNLGRSLIMLAIHDIGETVVGDVLSYQKTEEDEKLESREARKILNTDLIPFYDEFEARDTDDARFAKSVDALAPHIHEIEAPHITKELHKHHNINLDEIENRSHYFSWDYVLKNIFKCIVIKLKQQKS